MQPLVSVIVPAYNNAWCIERTLGSIAAQTYPNFEVIVVVDGSKDGTLEIAQSFAARDARMTVIYQENRGVAGARNRAIEASSGVFIAPVDADDLWAPAYLASQVKALEAADARAPFVFCYSHWIDEHDNVFPAEAPPLPRSDFIGLLHRNAVGNGSCIVFRRDKLMAVGGYDARRAAMGADDWHLSLVLTADHPAVVNPQFLIGYRRTAHSLSGDPGKQIKSVMFALADIKARFPSVPARHFRRGRSDALLWSLPRWADNGKWGAFAKYTALAVIADPLCVLDREAQFQIVRPIKTALQRALGVKTPRPAPLRRAADVDLLPPLADASPVA